MNVDNCILLISPYRPVAVWILLLSLSFAGCGSDAGPRTTKPGTTFGSCTVTGNMNSFEVKSDKDITRIQVGSISGGAGVNINMAGARTTIKKVDDRTLTGSASGQVQLNFTVHHSDGSTSEVSVLQ